MAFDVRPFLLQTYLLVELGGVLLKTPHPRLDPQKSDRHDGQRCLVNGIVYQRKVRALDNSAP